MIKATKCYIVAGWKGLEIPSKFSSIALVELLKKFFQWISALFLRKLGANEFVLSPHSNSILSSIATDLSSFFLIWNLLVMTLGAVSNVHNFQFRFQCNPCCQVHTWKQKQNKHPSSARKYPETSKLQNNQNWFVKSDSYNSIPQTKNKTVFIH